MVTVGSNFVTHDDEGGFPTAIDALRDEFDDGEMPRTLLELRICEVVGAIRDREKWWEKVFDETIVEHWREEVCNSESDFNETAVFEYALGEARWMAKLFPGPARPAAADSTFSVNGVSENLLERLLNGVAKIRETSPRDVHPGSDGLVIDYVHPSMYAYEQGVTPVIGDAAVLEAPAWDEFIGCGTARPEAPPGPVNAIMCSLAGLAWLPSEFLVSEDGETCSINSYINSLHPKIHEDLYQAISDAFVVALPLFEAVLTSVGTGISPQEMPLRISNNVIWIEPSDANDSEDSDSDSRRAPQGEHPLQDDSDFDSWRGDHTLVMPEVPRPFVAPSFSREDISLKGKRLQVIVKLASIELTPNHPQYAGGTWHVEGMRNERIVATTCMYLESDNISESHIEFRTAVRTPDYEQNDNLGVKLVLGLRNEEALVQPRGVSRTMAGRALAWPNTLQHRVRPFELADATRPGRRTILCFFLIDPTLRVRSTATVPPQINAWIAMEAEKVLPRTFPKEVREIVGAKAGGMSFEDACERRQRLMKERKTVVKMSGEDASFFERSFSLCEH